MFSVLQTLRAYLFSWTMMEQIGKKEICVKFYKLY